jgi:DNA-binding GntR family transcriptional regulator
MDRRRTRLTEQVFAQLRDEIVRGALAPGAALSEQEVCGRLSVSRTPVREAFIKLAEEGLVDVYPQVGTFVAPIAIEAVMVGQYVREHLECALVADAARRMDATAAARIADLLDEQRRTVGDAEAFYDLDNDFHQAIAELSGQPGVWAVILKAKTQFDRVRYLSVRDPERIPEIMIEHERIAAALVAGDAETAQAALRLHLRQVFRSVAALGLDRAEPASAPPRRGRARASRGGGR